MARGEPAAPLLTTGRVTASTRELCGLKSSPDSSIGLSVLKDCVEIMGRFIVLSIWCLYYGHLLGGQEECLTTRIILIPSGKNEFFMIQNLDCAIFGNGTLPLLLLPSLV